MMAAKRIQFEGILEPETDTMNGMDQFEFLGERLVGALTRHGVLTVRRLEITDWESDYDAAYRRATEAVEAAIRSGLIVLDEGEGERGHQEAVLRAAEHFMVGLGTNPN